MNDKLDKQPISKKAIMRYALTPQVVARFKEVFGTGLYHVAYFIALVYSAVRLLPNNHPYVRAENMGRFGIRHVIVEAAHRLQVNAKNIDKVILFFLVLLGLGIVAAQVVLLIGGVFIQSALAAGGDSFFVTPNPAQDLAFMFLDLVLGVPDVFKSCVSTTTMADTTCVNINGEQSALLKDIAENGFPFPIHHAIHKMLQLYSTGLLLIGAMITVYFIATVLGETAQTGTPFGKRFNKVWAPLRLVVAFALLIPVANGLNAAQYIVLYSAKFGSGFATNGWIKFNDTLSQETLADANSLVSTPKSPQVVDFLRFMFVAKTCKSLYETYYPPSTNPDQVKPYLVRGGLSKVEGDHLEIQFDSEDTPYTDSSASALHPKALYEFANGADSVDIVFGVRMHKLDDNGNPIADKLEYPQYPGGVWPVCGKMKFKFSDTRKPYPVNGALQDDTGYAEPGTDALQRYYWHTLKLVYFTVDYLGSYNFDDMAQALVEKEGPLQNENASWPPKKEDEFPDQGLEYLSSDFQFLLSKDCQNSGSFPDPSGSCSYLEATFRNPNIVPQKSIVQLQTESSRWNISQALRDKGWAAAGIWYNKVAEMNGALTEAVLNIPQPVDYPLVMQTVAAQKIKYNQNTDPAEQYNPTTLANGQKISYNGLNLKNADDQASILWQAYEIWKEAAYTPYNQNSGNVFVNAIQAIFGTEGLYNLRENKDVHPLAQLVGIGKSLVESSIRNIGYGVTGVGLKALFQELGDQGSAGFIKTVTSFVTSVTMIAVLIGFILYYVVPFLPFLYFFFAVTGWVKGIVEALVGVPLWALAHIRIDGDGLPGSAAVNGYYLILEIFLRPILIVFGLLASISIFAALVGVLGDLWGTLIQNAGGFDVQSGLSALSSADTDGKLSMFESMGSAIDQFFYTIVYAILVYMIGMSSFKLIDQIPNQILRWMGQSVNAFNDDRGDPAQGIMQSLYTGGSQLTGEAEKIFK